MHNKLTQNNSLPPREYSENLYSEDEIDLADLIRILIRQKWVIVGVTVLVTLGALLFAYRQPTIFQSEIFFRPPTSADVTLLNAHLGYARLDDNSTQLEPLVNLSMSSEELFQIFINELRSRQLRRKVFNEKYPVNEKEVASVDSVFDGFNERIKLNFHDDTKNTNPSKTVSVSFEDSDPQLAADILNVLGERADRRAVEIAMQDAEGKMNVKKKALNKKNDTLLVAKQHEINDEIIRLQEADTIKRKMLQGQIDALLAAKQQEIDDEIIQLQEADAIKRKTLQEAIATVKLQAKSKRQDRIALLEEAYGIAHKAQIKNSLAVNLGEKTSLSEKLGNMQLAINSLPLYMYGETLLRAEIDNLSTRQEDEPFIADLRSLEEKLKLLEENEKIEALQERKNLEPFIPEARSIQKQLLELDRNAKIEALKTRKDLKPFIPEIRVIQKQLALLEGITFDPNKIRSVIVDQAAYPPKSPIKPQRKKIVVVGLALGLILGIFTAFLMNFVRNMWQKEKEA